MQQCRWLNAGIAFTLSVCRWFPVCGPHVVASGDKDGKSASRATNASYIYICANFENASNREMSINIREFKIVGYRYSRISKREENTQRKTNTHNYVLLSGISLQTFCRDNFKTLSQFPANKESASKIRRFIFQSLQNLSWYTSDRACLIVAVEWTNNDEHDTLVRPEKNCLAFNRRGIRIVIAIALFSLQR